MMCCLMRCDLLSDIPHCPLWRQVQTSYAAAHAASTTANHHRQARAYASFMITYGYELLNPSPTAVLLFSQCLANSMKDTRSVRNYLSGAKTYVLGAGGDISAFNTPLLPILIKGLSNISRHVETQAPPIPKYYLLLLCDLLDKAGPSGQVAKAAVLFGVASFLRQSNFLPQTTLGRGQHLLRRGDIHRRPDGLRVVLPSTKTIRHTAAPTVLMIAPAHDPRYCPVVACYRAWDLVNGGPNNLLFLIPPTGAPLTAPALTGIMRASLGIAGFPAARSATVHSLRRTGAHLAAAGGADIDEVMAHGTWTSSAVSSYLPKEASKAAPRAVAASLARSPPPDAS